MCEVQGGVKISLSVYSTGKNLDRQPREVLEESAMEHVGVNGLKVANAFPGHGTIEALKGPSKAWIPPLPS